MGRIFIAAKQEDDAMSGDMNSLAWDSSHWESRDKGTAAYQIILMRDLIVQILRSRDYEPLSVPEDLSTSQAIAWINQRTQPGDVALEIQMSDFTQDSGAATFYIAQNDQRRIQAEQLLQAYLRRVPQMTSQGAKPDTQTSLGYLPFCRNLQIPALQMQIGRLTNLEDQWVIPAQPQDIALGIAEGLAGWSRALMNVPHIAKDTPVNILLNGALHDDEGLLVHGNAYVPLDLVDQLNIDISNCDRIQPIAYRNLVYVRAIDLREFNIAVHWEKETQTLSLRSVLLISASQLSQIMGRGSASEVQLMLFLRAHNPESMTRFPDLPKLYREEAGIEGVNHDLAFAQMCVETYFLRFGGLVKPDQNNFAGLGGMGTRAEGQSFLDLRIGVRAHIQHLKAYASTEPLVQKSVDPRFHSVRRGVAPAIASLSRRWSAEPHYHLKILAILRSLYESADLL